MYEKWYLYIFEKHLIQDPWLSPAERLWALEPNFQGSAKSCLFFRARCFGFFRAIFSLHFARKREKSSVAYL